MTKIGLAGAVILELIFIFILMPWHKANDPVPANGERPSTFQTIVALGQPTRPVQVTDVAAQPAASAATASVATASSAPAAKKPVAPKVTPKPTGSNRTFVTGTTVQPQQQRGTLHTRDLAQGFQSTFGKH